MHQSRIPAAERNLPIERAPNQLRSARVDLAKRGVQRTTLGGEVRHLPSITAFTGVEKSESPGNHGQVVSFVFVIAAAEFLPRQLE